MKGALIETEEETIVATDSRSEEQVEDESAETIAETIETREEERSIEVLLKLKRMKKKLL